MATIQNENLALVPLLSGKVAAVVTYEVLWQVGDFGQPFFHSVALKGADPVADDTLAAMSTTPGWQLGGFPGTITPILALNVLERKDLDEDRDLGLFFVAIRNQDEVKGRISLNPLAGSEMTRETNIVRADFGA